ncbi:Protein transport protein yos1 [Beauveria bassiana]|nr:Protein transport protein yos1 [Beauveria bassiana]
MFFLGNLFYVTCLLINAVAILSEDRFLARINLSPGSHDPGFGTGSEPQSVQAKICTNIDEEYVLAPRAGARAQCTEELRGKIADRRTVPLIIANTLIILYELILG